MASLTRTLYLREPRYLALCQLNPSAVKNPTTASQGRGDGAYEYPRKGTARRRVVQSAAELPQLPSNRVFPERTSS